MMNTNLTTQTHDFNAVLRSLSVDSGVILCNRLADPTPEQAKFSVERAIWLSNNSGIRKYLVDARHTLPPNAQLRKTLREFICCFIGHFEAMAIIIDENPTSYVSAQFIFHNHELPDNMHFHLCTTMEEGRQFLSQY